MIWMNLAAVERQDEGHSPRSPPPSMDTQGGTLNQTFYDISPSATPAKQSASFSMDSRPGRSAHNEGQ